MMMASALFASLLEESVQYLREHPEVVAEIRKILAPPIEAVGDTVPEFMKVAEFAQHIGMCKRSVENMVTEGLPIVGKGRRRRVPVAEAVAWIRTGGADAEIEKRAQLDASRALRREAARKVQG